MADDKSAIGQKLREARDEYAELGGWPAFTNGVWLWRLVQRSFRNYWDRSNVDYLATKYGTGDPETIAPRLIAVAAKNAALLGAVTGAAVSTDEIVGLVTAGEGGIGIPVNLAIAATAVAAEAILLVRIQLQLVANLGKLYRAPLDPDDPEDILTILGFALGGSAADVAGKAGMRIAGTLGARVGAKILRRNIVKYAVPFVSIGIGTSWNYAATRTVGRVAINHFKKRVAELPGP